MSVLDTLIKSETLAAVIDGGPRRAMIRPITRKPQSVHCRGERSVMTSVTPTLPAVMQRAVLAYQRGQLREADDLALGSSELRPIILMHFT
jgi:hypothetical protein